MLVRKKYRFSLFLRLKEMYSEGSWKVKGLAGGQGWGRVLLPGDVLTVELVHTISSYLLPCDPSISQLPHTPHPTSTPSGLVITH